MVLEDRFKYVANFCEVGMMKTVAIWGSTGVIGTKALKIALNSGCRVVAIIGNRNHKLLIKQAKLAHPQYVGVMDNDAYKIVKDALITSKAEILSDTSILSQLDVDCCIMAISGNASVSPTFSCLGHAQRLAIASKEAIISGGKLLQHLAKQKGTELIPIDSEHNSIFQCLQGENQDAISEMILTASGGAFANLEEDELNNVSIKDALQHPNWNMGKKNTIDSATLINKALEIIEASYLFDMNIKKIKAVIHPNSIIHAMVRFSDNSYKTLMSYPDMNLPISYALNYAKRFDCKLPALDVSQIGSLQFRNPKEWQKRNIDLAYQAFKEDKVITFNISNEVAVAKFIKRELRFTDIYKYIINILEHSPRENIHSYEDIQNIIKTITKSSA